MLSVGNVSSVGGASQYYTDKDNYYFLGETSTEWFGKGADKLGLFGSVDKQDFEAVLKGELQDGSSLAYIRNGENHHQAGKDLTFSAPKSVSVLALVEGNKDLIKAHQDAVKKTLSEIEPMVSTRTMVEGIPLFTKTGNMVASLFMHDTNRNLDPHLHTHAIVANATFNHDSGKWQTLSSDRASGQGFTELVWDNQIAFGALYRQFLKEAVEELGFQTETVGKNGLWEIKGFSDEALKSFSTRSQQIQEAISPNASAKEKTITALDTRSPKNFENMDAVKQEWQQRFAEIGVTSDSLKALPRDDQPVAVSLNAKEAVAEAISELEREKPKFTHSDITTYAFNLAKAETNIIKQVQQEIDSLIQGGRLILTDKHHSIYTTNFHLEQERDVVQKISVKNNELNNITNTAGTQIGEQLKESQGNFNLVSVRGSNAFERSLLDDVANVAKANEKNYLVVVRNRNEKMNLIKNGYKGDVATVSDYLSQEKPEKQALVSVFQSERMTLDVVNGILEKSISNGDTLLVMDTGGRKFSGLTRDVSESMGIKSINITENNKDKRIVFEENVDRADQIDHAVRAYTLSRFTGKDNAILQVANSKNGKVITEAVNKVRSSLKNAGLLGEKEITLKSLEYVFVKNFKDKSNYQAGFILEQRTKDAKMQYRIDNVNEKKGTLSLSSTRNEKDKITLSMKELNAKEWKMYREKPLVVSQGEKLKATSSSNGIKFGEELTVTALKKGNFFFKERIVVVNEKGIEVSLRTDKEVYLQQNYVEGLGASRNDNRDRIIAVLSQKNMDNRTLAEISKGSSDVFVVTSMSGDKIAKNINQDKAKLTITDSLKSFFEKDDLESIKQASIEKEGDFLTRSVNVHIEKAMLETKDKVSFNALDVVRNVAEQGVFKQEQVRTYLAEEIKQGNIIPLDKQNPTLNGEFIPLSGLQTEQKILSLVHQGIGASEPILSDISHLNLRTLTKSNGSTITLTEGQQKATEQFLTSRDTFVQVVGLAGVGKTSSLELLVSTIKEHNLDTKIIALAPTHKATEEMVSRGLDDGQTYQSFLEKYKEGDISKNEFANTLFVIDEVSMIGNNPLLRIMEIVVNHGGRAVLLGDPDQLKSIEGGTPFATLYERGKHLVTIMKDIVRQNEQMKPIIYDIYADKIPTAFDKLNALNPREHVARIAKAEGVPEKSIVSLPVEVDKEDNKPIYASNSELYKLAVDDYLSRIPSERAGTLLLTPTNKGVDELNRMVHEGLVREGIVKNSITVSVMRQKNFSTAEMQDPKTWAKNKGNVVKQGENYYRIGSTDNQGNVILLTEDGKEKLANTFHLSSDNSAIFEQRTIQIGEGDKIRIRATEKDSAVNNNAIGVVRGIDKNGKLTLDMGNGILIQRDPLKEIGDRHFTLGYAFTTFSSQGGSSSSAIGVIPRNTFHFQELSDVYVAASRAVKHFQLFTNDLDGLIDKVHQTGRGARESTLDKFEGMEKAEVQRKILSEVKHEQDLFKNAKPLIVRAEYDKRTLYFARYDTDKAELLLRVVDEKSNHKGNYHLPFSGVSKEIDLSNGYYKGASGEGLHIRLSKEFDEKGTITAEMGELYDYLEKGKLNLKGKGAIIPLDNDGRIEEVKQDQISQEQLKQDELSEQKASEDVVIEDEKNLLNLSQDDEAKLAYEADYELSSEQDKAIEKQEQDEVKNDFNRLGNDEVNIITHSEDTAERDDKPSERVKEKELV